MKIILVRVLVFLFILGIVWQSEAAGKRKMAPKGNDSASSDERFGDIGTLGESIKASSLKTIWDLTFRLKSNDYQALSPSQLHKLSYDSFYKGGKWLVKEQGVGFDIVTVLDNVYYPPIEDPVSSASFPFRLTDFRKKKTFMIFSMTDKVFNTLRMSRSEMAGKIAADYIVPNAKQLYAIIARNKIDVLAVFVGYGTKDFSTPGFDDDMSGNVVGFFLDATQLKKYDSDGITDQELVEKAFVVVSEGKSDDFRRIKAKTNN